ncbi:hypothetical protein DWB77_00002 [Streptomyces hundungensis]|uniref:Uncharacterized protein n=1 Tax=Streptomyces hundungensis TaxID=1077946 RepID=A0A387H2L9_9ACTN|nr:hypothetical protein DWB77_00002 [Streptomyces hundungensis]
MTPKQYPGRVFLPGDFDEPCEDCQAPAGAYCRPGCGSGYTADDARADAQKRTENPA